MKNILFLLTIILLFSCSPKQEDAKVSAKTKPDTSEEVTENASDTFGLDEYQDSILDSNSPRYWYVYYTAHRKKDESEWSGYKVIKMNESYFDVNKARMELYPSCVDEDYVGIQFFKEVSEKTYVEYTKEQ